MPPDEQAIASWTALGPAPSLTANPCCPGKECTKADCLISHCYAAARAAHMGNALAILLAAL